MDEALRRSMSSTAARLLGDVSAGTRRQPSCVTLGAEVRAAQKTGQDTSAAMASRIPIRPRPMLATLVARPFNRPGWGYEEKYDGERMLAYKEGTRVRLLSRNGKDRTERFPRIVGAIQRLRPETLLLDGEVVVFDRQRISRFQLLQQGGGAAVYAVFDCLYCAGKDLRNEPLSARRSVLQRSAGGSSLLLLSRQLASNGLEAYRIAKRKGYEGVVAKDLASPYVAARSKYWLKVKVHQEDDFIVCGHTQPAGSREYFGALLLGAYEGRELHYVGKVGTGFDRKSLADLHRKFQPLVRSRPAFVDPPRGKGMVFLAPRLIAQVSFQEWTADRKLRQPVFLGLRDDKDPREVSLPQPTT
jgi:bifunctional non-homologous end joining protein LigD